MAILKSTEAARHLHILGATGQVRIEKHDGRDHLVIPVIALMEGVIHAVNAETPEFVPFATLEKAAASWNGKPVTLGHPKKNGRQCSADDPSIRASHGLGVIKNARAESKKLLCEAWIDRECAKRLDSAMLARLEAGKTEEVSVGAFVMTDGHLVRTAARTSRRHGPRPQVTTSRFCPAVAVRARWKWDVARIVRPCTS